MRHALYKCPNHLKCTIAYHGDDVEIVEGMALVCSECGSPLVRVRKKLRSALIPTIVNLVVIGCIAVGVWLAWPNAVKMWKRLTAPPAEKAK
jgi:hypothetical protein